MQLTQDQSRSIILHRHGLIEPFAKPLEAMNAVFAVQTQYAASLPMALAVRTKGLKAGWHHKAEHQDVVKSWTLRHTLHAQAAEDHDLFLAAAGKRMFDRYLTWITRNRKISPEKLQGMMEGILEALADGPLTRPEIHDRVPAWKEVESTGWGIDVMGLAYLGKVKLIITDGGPTQFALHECRVNLSPLEAMSELLRRYLRSYGPATLADFSYWTGVPLALIKPAFEQVREELTEVTVAGMRGQRWLYQAEVTDDLPKVRLLAKFDPLTMGHKDKTLFLEEKHRTQIIRIAGQVEAAVLANGKMVGSWRFARKGSRGEITIEPFRATIAKTYHAGIEREARKIGKALGFNETDVRHVSRG